MKFLNLFIVVFFLLTISGYSQVKSISIKAGDKFQFNTTTEVDIAVNMQGQESKTNSFSNALTDLTCIKNDSKEIKWKIQDLSNRIKIIGQTGFPRSMDTTLVGNINEFTTTTNGKILKGIKKYQISETDNTNLFNVSMKQNLLVFSPLLLVDKSIGDSWIDTKTDTLLLTIMRTTVITSTSIKKTFKSVIDTLGNKVAIINFQTIKSSVNSNSDEVTSSDMSFEGTINTNGDFYYSLNDGLLVFSKSETDSDLNLTMKTANNLVFPIKQKAISTYIRTLSPKIIVTKKNTKNLNKSKKN
ncbi:MAG: hypothetical protein IPP08_05695 [Chlorobiota bacterium]|nr:MAG: hypothetical protein IPP08_05695 [Chlorobiota bacterium]